MKIQTSVRNSKVYEDNGTFFFVNNVEDKLLPGFYRAGIGSRGPYLRPQETVSDQLFILEDSVQEKLIADLKDFWSKKALYQEYQMLWKRGILLEGPPGSGKTSAILQLVEAVREAGGFAVMIDDTNQGEVLRSIRRVEPDRPILAIVEEIEEEIQYDESGWMSLLDGELQIDGIVWLATTNYIEKLPPRVKNRPSRFDVVATIGMPSKNDRARFLNLKLPKLDANILAQWAIETEGFSMAHLKELILSVALLGVKYEDALARLKTMLPKKGEE